MSPLITIENLYKNYGTVQAVNGMNLSLEPNQVVGLLGENGSGKTTLLQILAGTITAYRGTVLIDGKKPGAETKALVSYLPDKPYFRDGMKVAGALELFSDFYADFDEHKARELLAYFQLGKDMKISAMSKGMIEKLQIAMVMSRNARVYLLDEPISGVDPAARDVILKSIVANFSDDAVMVMSTHLIHDIESIVDQAIFMRNGRIIYQAMADDIRENEGKSIDQKFREVYSCLPLS